MTQKITAQINFFGPHIKKEEISKILNSEFSDTMIQVERDMLGWFFELPFSALSKEILDRYVEVTENSHMSIVPHTKEIFERLLKPLRSAKRCYCLGDYAATIALCGVVGEMLAILLWKINDVRLKGNPIAEQDEIGLFGKSFEKLGQERRLEILKTFGHILETQFNCFRDILGSRRPYLHFWNTGLRDERADALKVFKISLQLFKEVTGVGLADAGTVKVNPLLLKLFKDLEPEGQNTGGVVI